MKEQIIIIIALVLCAGFESIFEVTWKKELVLGIVFTLGMWQDKLSYKRDDNLVKNIEELVKIMK
ncbi:MAG: hypothetical protein ISS66_04045 [Desulfobacteraceae bacterium]|nr:hypothetical protein [Desulfobacteraceae bacterium]